MKTLIIAEAGVNHNGDIDIAKKLIEQAAEVGADMIKFQSFVATKSIANHAPKAQYQLNTTESGQSQLEMVRALELSPDAHRLLHDYCNVLGIKFFSTAFDVQSFDLLCDLGLNLVKIPSGEITNLPLIRYMTRHGYPVLLSTGMCTLGDIEAALSAILAGPTQRKDITILHCTTEYPCPLGDVNLLAMVSLADAFKVRVGYSDHTEGIEVPVAAVALGASVIEKHFTLDRTLVGPDHRASLEPDDFRTMVTAIRNVENALGDGIKRPSFSELKNLPIARKSIVALRQIEMGEIFTQENIGAKRPGTGMSPMYWDEVIGKKAKRAFRVDEMIEL